MRELFLGYLVGESLGGCLAALVMTVIAIAFGVPLLIWSSPALGVAFVLIVLIKRRRRFLLGATYQELPGWRASRVFLVIGGLSALIGYGLFSMVEAVRLIAAGNEMGVNVLRFAGTALAAVGGGWLFHKINRGDFMPNIFDIIDDPDRFDDFTRGNKPATVAIEPEALRSALKQDVIGQDAVVDELVTTVARRVRLPRPNKPFGVFLLVGATGSGKTELAKSLAKHAFENRLIRFDMNEFTEAHSTQRLIGSPPGYVGSGDGGQLTRAIMRQRSGVLLLDEIEKAHSDVYKLIMGLLDEGRITEQSTGKTADASAFVIIMTSNAEQAKLAALMQTVTDPDERRRATKDTLLGVFKPEQLARVDEIFCFAPLDRRATAQVIGKFLYSFAAEAGVQLAKVDADLLIQTILRHEKQESYGIRELVRLIEKAVIDGMLTARDSGARAVEIRVGDQGRIEVLPSRAGSVAS